MEKITFTLIFSGLLAVVIILSACTPSPEPTLVPTPTATHPLVPASNKNVEVLNAAQAALGELKYGFAPLLLEDETHLVIESGSNDEQVRLAYPLQPVDPTNWPGLDSFMFAYAARNLLVRSPQVRGVTLGKFDVAAPVNGFEDRISHFAVWVRFVDGSEAVVDLTPLATNFAPKHLAREFLTDPNVIHSQFNEWRAGVSFSTLQPMKVIRRDGNVYYLVAKALALPDRYEFSLRIHLVQTATPMRALQLTRGATVSVEVNRADFEAVHELVTAAGPTIFNEKPELLSRTGDKNPTLLAVLDEHLPLLWHMVTKLEHQPSSSVDAATPKATPTPTSTSTPTPTPTPSPTPTPANFPLITS